MPSPVIRVENLSKMYHLGTIGSGTIRDDLHRWWASVRGKEDPLAKVGKKRHSASSGPTQETIWALRDVSFEVVQGEVLGVIGRNGAGKSTLLKILSRVTSPSTGVMRAKGRIASLLEVGTGFHPELTGRDNIFLNGAILGMTKAEIRRRFDEIVAFSEVEKFIDTPVKRYSSGMYVRLAFAVAAHLEPEILIVDEVLAVGDAAFQQKCLGKMGDVAKRGRTVLFVSHQMQAVNRLCQRCILLDGGTIRCDGPATEVTGVYLRSDAATTAIRCYDRAHAAPGDDVVRLKSVKVLSQGRNVEAIDIRHPVTIEVEYLNLKPDARLLACVAFFNDQGTLLFPAVEELGEAASLAPAGTYRATCTVPGNMFAEGQIRVYVEVSTREPFYQIHVNESDVVAFQVVDRGEVGSVRAGWGRPLPGVMRPAIPVLVQNISEQSGDV